MRTRTILRQKRLSNRRPVSNASIKSYIQELRDDPIPRNYNPKSETPEVTLQCPECNSKGFKPAIGTRASGKTFQGCEFCTGKT